jgi:hypothetical protein
MFLIVLVRSITFENASGVPIITVSRNASIDGGGNPAAISLGSTLVEII